MAPNPQTRERAEGNVPYPPTVGGERQRPEPRPRDHADAARDIACELADVAGQLPRLEGETMNWLENPDYSALKLRLENAHAAVEAALVGARRRARLKEGGATCR